MALTVAELAVGMSVRNKKTGLVGVVRSKAGRPDVVAMSSDGKRVYVNTSEKTGLDWRLSMLERVEPKEDSPMVADPATDNPQEVKQPA